ncbi:MAG TPA: ribonuclease HII [Dissulfurispiraceae bacterium]|nr:ribonuclease HII [Dissulfurispiraceae bacterium]
MDIFAYDEALRKQGFFFIAGVDEAGRGPLAGPVVAAAVILPAGLRIEGVRDSKKVPERQRERLYAAITERAEAFGIGLLEADEIDRTDILRATRAAMTLALSRLGRIPDIVLLDAVRLPNLTLEQKPLIKGDSMSAAIAAASIIAKVTRDRLMLHYHGKYPQYGFASHKGYATSEHIASIRRHGPCPIHRMSFDKVKTVPLPFA